MDSPPFFRYDLGSKPIRKVTGMLTEIEAKEKISGFDPSGADVLAFALSERDAGRPAAIVTLAAIDGSSPRSIGAQMAVAQDGRFAGSISSGCLERAIIDMAREMMAQGRGGFIRYGKDSLFRDIILPCGSGVDLLFTINPSADALHDACDALKNRRAVTLAFDIAGAHISDGAKTELQGETLIRRYTQPLKILAAGLGAELTLLSRIALASGYTVCALSPDQKTLEESGAPEKIRLQSASSLPELDVDPWTAIVLLFHDREWDVSILPAALETPAFYIGAVGSPKTHSARLDALRMIGVDEEDLKRLKGPIGLIPATRDPSTLAVSILADILTARLNTQ